MIWFLRLLFAVIIASMIAVTGWASLHQPLGVFARSATIREPWVIATLFDAYWGFITFYVWVAWKEQAWAARLLWFVAIILLGNMAMSVYMLAQLFAIPAAGPLAWLVWALVHVTFLIGFRNRVVTMLEWARTYAFHHRAGRIIVGGR